MPDGPRCPGNSGQIARAILLGGLALGWAGSVALADRITLRGGGQVKGKLVPDTAHPGQVLLIGETGKTPMVLKKDQVVQVVAEKGPLDEYVVLREKERPTADKEYELGSWCEEHNLKDLALVHYEQAVKRDGNHSSAHQKLGHVLLDGRWLNADEVKEAQGMVRYKGRWMTPEEKERLEMLAATAAEGSAWVKKLRTFREAYVSGVEGRAREAERRLLAIEEPIAIGPILQVLGEDPLPAVRAITSKVLGGIPGAPAANALVGRFLQEGDEEVRQATLNELAKRDADEVVPLLTRSLRSKYHEIVNRSAWGLGNLNATAAVPKLVPALITIEYQVMMVDTADPSSSGAMSFNAVSPAHGSHGGAAGFTSGAAIPVLTPPVVGPGVAAYGATSVPYQNGASFGAGGGGGSRGPTPRLVPVEYRNDEVLAALVKMTGRDFGYDIPTWKRWVANSFKLDSAPTRRVPEP